MKKVLMISLGDSYGGLEKFELEISKQINKDIKIDILTPNKIFNEDNTYDLGIKRNTFINKIKFHKRLSNFLKRNHYDIVHINDSVYLSSREVVKICRKNNIKHIVAHSHSLPKYNIIKRTFKRITNNRYINNVDSFLSSSSFVATSLLTDKNKHKSIVLKNGIVVDNYKYNEKLRKKYRDKYNLNNKKVYGTTGRFAKVKNHIYLINLFNEIQKKEKDAFLVLIGCGGLKEEYIQKINELKLENKVLILDFQNNINELLNMFDVFVMPSITEGFGLSLLEAETNGLTCFYSDTIPSEAVVTPYCYKFNLDEDIIKIRDIIIKTNISHSRNDVYKIIKENKLDIKDIVKKLEIIYKEL